ncbi:hypothetical protein EMCG_03768 [[Emmonsia] crescens]|uniref:Uncharacterized protein n=1 Tax=[Emmonsia] crescens TaxID=73230 RepID=A0A0G2IZT9_9EURO|nr:hypothetical protein EMCG_03768 [Emmonsia crescens UAMH 3008]
MTTLRQSTVEILITLEMPCTESLLVVRGVTQNLKRRMFDATTCKSIGLETTGDEENFRDDECQFRVHLEAVMDERLLVKGEIRVILQGAYIDSGVNSKLAGLAASIDQPTLIPVFIRCSFPPATQAI